MIDPYKYYHQFYRKAIDLSCMFFSKFIKEFRSKLLTVVYSF
jgi:hypothetical protein